MESASKGQLLSESDLVRIEKAHPNGLSSAQIIQIFQQRGVKLSEATFRKYVQLGLLPRCRRVGSKGKHRGSRGVYPCATVRRINAIKRLMARSYTIEEIQQSFSNFKSNIESVESALNELLQGFEREIARPQFDHAKRRTLTGDIREARQTANDLVRRLIQIESHISFPEKTTAASGGRNLSDI